MHQNFSFEPAESTRTITYGKMWWLKFNFVIWCLWSQSAICIIRCLSRSKTWRCASLARTETPPWLFISMYESSFGWFPQRPLRKQTNQSTHLHNRSLPNPNPLASKQGQSFQLSIGSVFPSSNNKPSSCTIKSLCLNLMRNLPQNSSQTLYRHSYMFRRKLILSSKLK